jgi:hypothetical protein
MNLVLLLFCIGQGGLQKRGAEKGMGDGAVEREREEGSE